MMRDPDYRDLMRLLLLLMLLLYLLPSPSILLIIVISSSIKRSILLPWSYLMPSSYSSDTDRTTREVMYEYEYGIAILKLEYNTQELVRYRVASLTPSPPDDGRDMMMRSVRMNRHRLSAHIDRLLLVTGPYHTILRKFQTSSCKPGRSALQYGINRIGIEGGDCDWGEPRCRHNVTCSTQKVYPSLCI